MTSVLKWKLVSGPVVWLVITAYFLFTVIPYGWLMLTSLKPESQTVKLPIQYLPSPPVLTNYLEVLLARGGALAISVGPAFVNTVIIAFSSTLVALIVGLPAAYSFAKYRFPVGRVIFLFILITRMFPIIALAIPLFQLIRAIGLYDSKLGLIFAYTSLTLPFVIWLMYAFFQDVPPELEEAARIDGANFFQMFTRVILPIATPGIAATFVLSLIYPWNDLLLSSILSASSRSQTLPAALAQYNTGMQLYWGHLSAASVIASLPLLIFTLLLQRYIVQGLTLGSVKG